MCSFKQLACQARPTLFNHNSNESLLNPFTVSVNKCGGSYNTTDNPCSRVCIPNIINNMNVKVYNLMLQMKLGVNETRCLVQHESCE